MMTSKIIAVFSLTILIAIYDKLIKVSGEDYTVNLSILYFVSIYGYIVWTILFDWTKYVTKLEKNILSILASIWIVKIILNLFSIGQSWDIYTKWTSNKFIDIFTWTIVILFLTAKLWQKHITSRR